ncbi:sigma factor-like helix-turn-helix DNA-binding protein [Streptomyces jeddahensis]|uniref:Sigma-70, region 4 n=1 Tax=Streptomyces jeddahensis TaxID=1716141 RepID=A0A177HS73_9ACTN|nr:sigma factor-like helix-turn-helix DNA-binding protein [Streptomyces jeddahensis]OAH13861.1 sigma-70, region 4 [Streptomyces jeddahensis]
MRRRQASQDARRAREFETFVAGAAGRLLHAATLLTAEARDDNPRARALLTASLAHTYATWDRLRGEDPYDRARQQLAIRYARGAWHRYRGHSGLLERLAPQERLILVLRMYEGVAEEQTAALLGLPVERVRAICARAISLLLHPPRGPAPKATGPDPAAQRGPAAQPRTGPEAGADAGAAMNGGSTRTEAAPS